MGFRYLDRLTNPEQRQTFLELMDMAMGSGEDVQEAFALAHRLRDSAPMEHCLKLLRRDPASAALLKARQAQPSYSIEALRQLPAGSLGSTFASVMDTIGYDINFYPKASYFNNLETDADMVNYRVFATHDLHHILTGFSLDGYGELGVISVSVAQFNYPGFAFLDLISLLSSWMGGDTPMDELQTPAEQASTTTYQWELIHRGLAIGQKASLLFAIDWTQHMDKNLESLRRDLGINPVMDGPFSWYSNPSLQQALGLR